MSRLYKSPICISSNLKFTVNPTNEVTINNGKDTWQKTIHPLVKIDFGNHEIKISNALDTKESRMQAGTAFSILKSACIGLTNYHQRKVLLVGVGYRCFLEGKRLTFNMNFSKSQIVDYIIPQVVQVSLENPNTIVLQSYDKEILGKVASEIRRIRPPEAYKGKGVRYEDEVVIIKTPKKKTK